MARILTTVVGSYPLPDWLARAPSEQALIDATRVVIATSPGRQSAEPHSSRNRRTPPAVVPTNPGVDTAD